MCGGVKSLHLLCRAVPSEMVHALVSWDHTADYPLPTNWLPSRAEGFTKTYDLDTEEHAFLVDHTVDGRIILPVSKTFVCWIQQVGRPAIVTNSLGSRQEYVTIPDQAQAASAYAG